MPSMFCQPSTGPAPDSRTSEEVIIDSTTHPTFSAVDVLADADHFTTSRGVLLGCWNINGNIGLKLKNAGVRKMLKSMDVCFLSETWLHEGEQDAVSLPQGYNIAVHNRHGGSMTSIGSGGIAFVYHEELKVSLVDIPDHPDIMALAFADIIIVGVYICPSSSDWSKWCNKAPNIALSEILAYLALHSPNARIIVLGDFNARLGSKPNIVDWPRESMDKSTNARTSWLLSLLDDENLRVVNGSNAESKSPGAFTCFQARGCSVVDLILWPANDCANLKKGSLLVAQKTSKWSDHRLVTIAFDVVTSRGLPQISEATVPLASAVDRSLAENRPMWYRQNRDMDRLCKRVIMSALTGEKVLQMAYGGILGSLPTVREVVLAVYIKKDASRTMQGVMVVLEGCDDNAARLVRRLPEAASINETAATLFALAWIVRNTESRQKLVVYGPPLGFLQLIGRDLAGQINVGYSASYGPCAESFVTEVRFKSAPLEVRSPRSDAHRRYSLNARRHGRESWRLERNLTLGRTALAEALLPDLIRDLEFSPCQRGHKVIVSLKASEKPSKTEPWRDVTASLTGVSMRRTRGAVRGSMRDAKEKMLKAETSGEWWRIVKDILSPKKRPAAVSIDQLRNSFYARLNPVVPTPAHFDSNLQAYYTGLADSIPSSTEDTTTDRLFSSAWSSDDVARIKRKVATRATNSAKGADAVSYSTIMSIPNDELAILFNECFNTMGAPTQWLTTTLIGIAKRGKPAANPESYRLIGLESCLLKVLTLLIDARLRRWSDSLSLVPVSQNGFKPKMRTHNNSFILRLAIEKSRALGKSLFVVFIDLKNAFPATDVATLWVKMRRAGAGGKLFDWLRMLYLRMAYRVSQDGKYADCFKSLMGLLTGDSLSPMLWLIFFGDLHRAIPSHVEDVMLDGTRLCHVEQADDVAIFSTSQEAVQFKLDAFVRWCQQNFMTLSISKTKAMIFGPLPASRLPLNVCGVPVKLVASYKFVGIMFGSTERDIFQHHYIEKAGNVRKVMNTAFSIEKHVGGLSVHEGITLYKAQIDPHLTFGAEVAIDIAPSNLHRLEREQVAFLRRLLGLSKYSSVAPLFTETGVMPLRFRQTILALGYARYATLLPRETLPKKAVKESLAMSNAGVSGWAGDLVSVLLRLGVQRDIVIAGLQSIADADVFAQLVGAVYAACDRWLLEEVNSNARLWILQARFKLQSPCNAGQKTLANSLLRPYTGVHVMDHRLALTRLVTSQHRLAVELLRRGDGQRRLPVPRAWRLCRLCRISVEDETHAVLVCSADSRLVSARAEMWNALGERTDKPKGLQFGTTTNETLVELLRWDKAAARFGKLVDRVFTVFADIPAFVPDRSLFVDAEVGDAQEEEEDDGDSMLLASYG